jgi:hypothetical protein
MIVRSLRAGDARYAGAEVIPIDSRNPNRIPNGTLVGLDAAGNLTTSAPFLGVLSQTAFDDTPSIGISGVFNVVGVSGAVGTAVADLPRSIIMSTPFTGHDVDRDGNQMTVENIVMLKI